MRFLLAIFIISKICFALEVVDLQNLKNQELQGQFIQTKILKSFDNEITLKGFFSFSKDALFWKTNFPIHNALKITQNGIFELQNNAWIPLSLSSKKALFLELMRLNIDVLQKYFTMQLRGNEESWELLLTPQNPLIQKVFKEIQINGGYVNESPFVTEMIFIEKEGDITKTTFIIQ